MPKKKERPDKRVKNSVSRNETIKIVDMTRKQLEAVPARQWHEEIVCDYLVILPMRSMHDSGYRMMDFVAIKDGKPLMRVSGCSDVLHIDGIGGGGYRKEYSELVERKSWSMDCLRKSGLLRIWAQGYNLICGKGLSSFELWAVKCKE